MNPADALRFEQQHERDNDREPPRRARLVLELSAVGDEVSSRQRHTPTDGAPHIRHDTAQVAASHVALHDHVALTALVLDDLGPFDRSELRDLRQRHGATGRCTDERLSYGLGRRKGPLYRDDRDSSTCLP
jgi:hypothetical protein